MIKKILVLFIALLFVPNEICASEESTEMDSLLTKLESMSVREPNQLLLKTDSVLIGNILSPMDAARIHFYRAQSFRMNSNGNAALQEIGIALEVFEEQKNTTWIIQALISKASAETTLEQYVGATNSSLRALELAEKIHDPKLVASANSSLAYIAYSTQDFEKTIYYLKKTEALQIQEKDSIGLSGTYNNIAIFYKNWEDYQNAITYNLRSLELNQNLGLIGGVAKSYSNLGIAYNLLGNKTKAVNFLQRAIDINDSVGITNSVPVRSLADLYQKNGQIELSKQNYKKALVIDKKNSNISALKESYSHLMQIAVEEKDFKSALGFQQNLDSVNLEIETRLSKQKIEMLENQQKLFVRNNEMEMLKAESRNTRVVLITLLILSLFIFLFFFQKHRLRASINEREKLVLEQKVLRSQMNPHFIFNALSAIQNSMLQNQPLESAGYLSRFAQLIRQNFDFANKDVIKLEEDVQALENYLETQKMRFPNKFEYNIQIDSQLDPGFVMVPPLLIQPLVENAIEHGFKDIDYQGEIDVNIASETDSRVRVSVEDNGVGFVPKSTDEEHALDILSRRLQMLNGTKVSSLAIEQNMSGTGTKVSFWINT